MKRETCDVAIVGGGIAGATLAYWLSRRPGIRVHLFERERTPGAHASGRNAALMLQNDSDPVGCRLAMESRAFYAAPPEGLFDRPPLRVVGSLRLASGPTGAARLERDLAAVRAEGLDVAPLTPTEAALRIPGLDAERIVGASWCPTDGILDIHAIVDGFIQAALRAGVLLATGTDVVALRRAGGRVIGVETARGPVDAGVVVDASGGWATRLTAPLGVTLPLRPTRRHLAVTEPLPEIDPGLPFCWDVDTPFYFRPESGGLLLCGCDQDDAPDLEETVRPEKLHQLADRASNLLPGLSGVGLAHVWAGIRTLTPDDHAVVGYEPRAPGLFWFAGLGGHGMCCGPALGRLAAERLFAVDAPRSADAAALAPDRFLSLPASAGRA